MNEEPPFAFDEQTPSFSVAQALRAPVGVLLDESSFPAFKATARRLLVGLLLVMVDVDVSGFDVVPDLLGGLAIVAGTLAMLPLSRVVGPARSGGRAVVLSVVHLLLLVPNDVSAAALGIGERTVDLLGVAQTVVALLGTAVVATVLARAHDSLGQLGRRDRWGATRRWSLVLAALWLPVASLAALQDQDPEGIVGLVIGAGSFVSLVLGVTVLLLLARSTAGSMNVDLRVGFGED